MRTVFEYTNYRDYLKEYYEENKALNKNFSFRYLSMKAGINSASFFKAVMDGTRNLTKKTILQTCNALKLNDKDAEFFENLVFFNQAKTLAEKDVYFNKLVEFQSLKNVKTVHNDEYEFYGEWYHCVVRELASNIDFKDNYSLLASMVLPSITAKQAELSVKMLLRLGFLKKDGNKYVQVDPVISSGNSMRVHQIIQFQIQMLNRAIEAYDRSNPEQRIMSSTTLNISKESFDYFKTKMREMRSHFLETARKDDKSDRVYQLNINLFPVSKTK
jgi:uncharacterized protein (TIGR02147 family)